MKRLIALGLVISLLALMLTACGQTPATTAATTAATTVTTTSGTTAASAVASTGAKRKDIVRVGFPAAIASMTWSPLIVAKMNGYFADEGIEIAMEQSYSSSATKMVAAGQAEFSLPGPHLTAAGIDGGMKIVSVFQLYPADIFGFAVREDSGIKTIADLAGKKIGTMTVTTANQVIPILEAGGVDPKSVTMVPVADARVQMLTEKSVDACWTWDGEWQQWQAEGMKISYVSGDSVYKSASNSVIANTDFVKNFPDITERFLRALSKGMYFCYANPRAAADITLKEWTSIKINLDQAEKIMKTAINFMTGGKDVMEGKTIGQHKQSSWELLMKDYVKMGIVKAAVPLDKCYTNQFIEKINNWDRETVKAKAAAYKFG